MVKSNQILVGLGTASAQLVSPAFSLGAPVMASFYLQPR